jgi:hypothetical protein
MEAFTLFFSYDVIIVTLLTAMYVLYMVFTKQLTLNYTLFIWIFAWCYYILIYLFSLKNPTDAKGLFLFCLLPTFTFFHWVIPFEKNKKITRVLTISSVIFISIVLLLLVAHHFSKMD